MVSHLAQRLQHYPNPAAHNPTQTSLMSHRGAAARSQCEDLSLQSNPIDLQTILERFGIGAIFVQIYGLSVAFVLGSVFLWSVC